MTRETLVGDLLTKHSNRNNGAASPKDRDERDCPDGVAEQSRSNPHTHSHDEHDCGRNDGNKPVHGAPWVVAVSCTQTHVATRVSIKFSGSLCGIETFRKPELRRRESRGSAIGREK